MNQAERRRFLIDALIAEEPRLAAARAAGELAVPVDTDGQRSLLRALMNLRPPRPCSPELLAVQNAYLEQRLLERTGGQGPVDAGALPPVSAGEPAISLWRGDITLLTAGAIVNAANSQGLGCFVPNHGCIDNAIHTFAGMQLRLACARELELRARSGVSGELHTGEALVTPGFNLPAAHVIHTVGPIVAGSHPTARDAAALARCYTAALDAASGAGAETIAFCCISTGVFGYPAREAASVAVATVRDWLTGHSTSTRCAQRTVCDQNLGPKLPQVHNEQSATAASPAIDFPLKVVFNVFSERDERIYRELLG